MPLLLTLADLALLLGFTLRLTRLVVTDDLGGWLIRTPARRWANYRERSIVGPGGRGLQSYGDNAETRAATEHTLTLPVDPDNGPRSKLVSGLDCPFCVGFWLAALAALSLVVAGGPGADGTLAVVWRLVAGVLTLNWLAAHIGSRLGDAGYAEEE